MLLAGYMQTRDPEAWKQLEQRIFETPDRAASKQELQDVLESPGAKHFDSIFGDGASQHFISAADPVNVLTIVLPFFRAGKVAAAGIRAGTAGAEATSAAVKSTLWNTTKKMGAEVIKGAPEMGALGAANQLRENPQSTPGDIARSALTTIAQGALVSAGLGAAGAGLNKAGRYIFRDAEANAPVQAGAATGEADPQTQPPPAPQPSNKESIQGDTLPAQPTAPAPEATPLPDAVTPPQAESPPPATAEQPNNTPESPKAPQNQTPAEPNAQNPEAQIAPESSATPHQEGPQSAPATPPIASPAPPRPTTQASAQAIVRNLAKVEAVRPLNAYEQQGLRQAQEFLGQKPPTGNSNPAQAEVVPQDKPPPVQDVTKPDPLGDPQATPASVHGTAAGGDMIPWDENPNGVRRSVAEARQIFLDHIKNIHPDFDTGILNHIDIKVAHATSLRSAGTETWAKYGPFPLGSGLKGEYKWSDILGRDKRIPVIIDERVLSSDQAIVGIIAHELHELNAIRNKIEESPNKSLPGAVIKRLIDTAHEGAVKLQNRAVVHVRSNTNRHKHSDEK